MCVPEARPSRVNRWLIVVALLGVGAALWLGRPWLATVTAGASLASLLLGAPEDVAVPVQHRAA